MPAPGNPAAPASPAARGSQTPVNRAPRLILASRSPRRAALLAEAGYAFEQRKPPFDDTGHDDHPGQSPRDWAITLARRKAQSCSGPAFEDAVVLCADTVCVDPRGRAIGKPATREAALNMIRGFVNTDHDIITAVALRAADGAVTAFADAATASFGPIDDDTIDAYLNTDQWADKAGGYNLFDRQAASWPITVTGDPTTVVGLPMERLSAILPTMGIEPSIANSAQPPRGRA